MQYSTSCHGDGFQGTTPDSTHLLATTITGGGEGPASSHCSSKAKDTPTDLCDLSEEFWLEDEDWGTWPLAVLLNMAASVLIEKE